MPGAGKTHSPAAAIDARGCDRKKEYRTADALHHEAVQLAQHVAQLGAIAQLRGRFGVNAIGDQRRADAVSGNIADEQVQMFVIERAHQAEVAANRAHRMIVGVDTQARPTRSTSAQDSAARGPRVLGPHRFRVCRSSSRTFASRNCASVLFRSEMSVKVTMANSRPSGSSTPSRADDYRHAASVFEWKDELEAVSSGCNANFDLLQDESVFVRRVELRTEAVRPLPKKDGRSFPRSTN